MTSPDEEPTDESIDRSFPDWPGFKRRPLLKALGAGAAVSLGSSVATAGAHELERARDVAVGRDGTTVPIEEVPIEFHRRAAQHVEEAAGSEIAPGWRNAQLSGVVREMFRPDVEGVAYYEFGVEPEGFVVLATGGHDFPFAHWDYQGSPIGAELAARAEENDARVSRLYKMDSLSYVGEDREGEMVAEVGARLVQVSGLTETHLEESETGQRGSMPSEEIEDDEGASEVQHELAAEEGPQEGQFEFGEWESWAEMKEGYEEAYGVLAEALRRDAEDDWEVYENLAEFGERLPVEEPHYEVLLFEDADFEVRGEGADFVSVEPVDREARPPALEIVAREAPDEKIRLEIVIEYGNGQTETRRFFVGGESASASVGVAQTTLDAEVAALDAAEATTTGGWDYWWAGGGGDQRVYYQYDYQGCAVGCGPVAWALLFGWADHQAATNNSYWAPRWGLFRQNAERHPAPDADAPRNQNGDVRKMIEEIHGYVNTFCSFGQGATYPWNMPDAWRWFQGRTGTWLWAWWNSGGIPQGHLLEKSRRSIIRRNTPAIIGTGWLTHYPLAYGYAYKQTNGWFGTTNHHHAFYLNKGYGDPTSGWVSGSTWFSGQIYPSKPPHA